MMPRLSHPLGGQGREGSRVRHCSRDSIPSPRKGISEPRGLERAPNSPQNQDF